MNRITPKQAEPFAQVLRIHLLNRDSGFGKACLRVLVDEIQTKF